MGHGFCQLHVPEDRQSPRRSRWFIPARPALYLYASSLTTSLLYHPKISADPMIYRVHPHSILLYCLAPVSTITTQRRHSNRDDGSMDAWDVRRRPSYIETEAHHRNTCRRDPRRRSGMAQPSDRKSNQTHRGHTRRRCLCELSPR